MKNENIYSLRKSLPVVVLSAISFTGISLRPGKRSSVTLRLCDRLERKAKRKNIKKRFRRRNEFKCGKNIYKIRNKKNLSEISKN